MNDSALLEKSAGIFNEIGDFYGEFVKILSQVGLFIAWENTGMNDREEARKSLAGKMQSFKQRIQNTPPPLYEVESEWRIRACAYWLILENEASDLEKDLFGGKEEWITGKSLQPLRKLEDKNTLRLYNFSQMQKEITEFEGKIHKVIADAAKIGEEIAKTAKTRVEGERDAWEKMANGKLDDANGKLDELLKGVSANGAAISSWIDYFRGWAAQKFAELLKYRKELAKVEKNPLKLEVMMAGITEEFKPGWPKRFANTQNKKRAEEGKPPIGVEWVRKIDREARQKYPLYSSLRNGEPPGTDA